VHEIIHGEFNVFVWNCMTRHCQTAIISRSNIGVKTVGEARKYLFTYTIVAKRLICQTRNKRQLHKTAIIS
jgi:hypothetical protein